MMTGSFFLFFALPAISLLSLYLPVAVHGAAEPGLLRWAQNQLPQSTFCKYHLAISDIWFSRYTVELNLPDMPEWACANDGREELKAKGVAFAIANHCNGYVRDDGPSAHSGLGKNPPRWHPISFITHANRPHRCRMMLSATYGREEFDATCVFEALQLITEQLEIDVDLPDKCDLIPAAEAQRRAKNGFYGIE